MTKKATKPKLARFGNQTVPDDAVNLRKVQIVRVSPTIFENIFATGYTPSYEVVEGLPSNVKLTGIRYEPILGEVHMLFMSEDWAEIAEGEVPPVFSPELRKIPQA
jgi:hypothetical protein